MDISDTDIERDDVADLLPLPAGVFHAGLALAEGDLHGYAIMQEIRDATARQVTVGPGTLYRSLERMVADGMIREVPDPEGSRRRRRYRLTPWGRRVIEAEAMRLATLVGVAMARGLLPLARAHPDNPGAA